jgi:hypothetical protein
MEGGADDDVAPVAEAKILRKAGDSATISKRQAY